MKPLNTYTDQVITTWLIKNHSYRVVTQFQLAAIFDEAYIKATTMRTAMNGFKQTGIYPTDRHVFVDIDFDVSLVTDIPQDHTSSEAVQTLSSLNRASSVVAHTSVEQTPSAVEQTLPSLGKALSSTGQATQSLTSSNRSTYVLANELSPIPKQTCVEVRRGGARGKTVLITSSPYKADLSSKAPKMGKSKNWKSMEP